MAEVFLLPTLAINKVTILGFIDIILELAEWLELLDKIIKRKLILFKRDLMTTTNTKKRYYHWTIFIGLNL